MDTLICAGGSGSRVLEAVVHLCAAGLGPPKLRVFVIDPDSTNGSLEKTRLLIEHYRALHDIYASGPAAVAGDYFSTQFDLVLPAGGLQRWSPVKDGQDFGTVLNYHALDDPQKEIVHLFFTQNELDMKMDVGFRGHPALGAAALSLLPLYQNAADASLWSAFHGALKNDVTTKANVMIVGSVFGGTGASAIHPLVRYLRNRDLLETNSENLKVGAVALVPYFQFVAAKSDQLTAKDIEEAAHSEDFPLASRSAAEYYDHLYANEDWDFDAMYWIGDDTLADVKYSIGGSSQANPAHFVDLLGALACFDFFSHAPHANAPANAQAGAAGAQQQNSNGAMPQGECWYCGPEVVADAQENTLSWDDLPIRGNVFQFSREQLRKRLHVFQMAAISHLSFFGPLLKDSRLKDHPYMVPWYLERFGRENDRLSGGTNDDDLTKLAAYWEEEYLPWWQQIHAGSSGVQLFNTAAWGGGKPPISPNPDRLGNLLHPDESHHDLSIVDELFAGMVTVARSGSGVPEGLSPAQRYLKMLAYASSPIVDRVQQQKSTQQQKPRA